MTKQRKPHRLNVAGAFYVEEGCCTACGVPASIAPELFGYDSSSHCYVKRQPESAAELEEALRVVRTQELGCVRFRGTDSVVLRRLAEAGEAAACDHPLDGVAAVLRSVVSFLTVGGPLLPKSYFEEFEAYLRTQYPHASFQTRARSRDRESFELSWFEDRFHELLIRADERTVIEHHGPLGLSEWLDDWLVATPRFTDVRWYTHEEWRLGQSGQSRPW